jgi:hypothetical protein
MSGLEHLGLVMVQEPRPAMPNLREVEAARNTTNVDVNQQLLIESAGDDSLSDVQLHNVHLPQARQDGSVGEE